MSDKEIFAQFLEDLELSEQDTGDLKKIKEHYHQKAKQHHPDAGGSEESFKKIHHAYKMLTDPSYRLKAKKSEQGPQNNLDAVFNIAIGFDQAFFGDELTITFNPLHIDDHGKLLPIDRGKEVHMDIEVINVKIREGTISGDHTTVKNRGLRCGDKIGNLILNYQVVPHPRFHLIGSDICSEERIPLEIMLVGGEVEVPTMWGLKTLRIPAGAVPGDQLVIKKGGVARVGHHLCNLSPEFPDKDELKENEVWKKLGINWERETQEEEALAKLEDEYQKFYDRISTTLK